MNGPDLLTMARQCCNYLFGLGGIFHACALDNDHCKIFRDLPSVGRCEAFEKMHPMLFPRCLNAPDEPESPLKPSTLENDAKTSEILEEADPRLKICECGKGFTPRCNRQVSCDECSARRRKIKQRGYLKAFRAKSP